MEFGGNTEYIMISMALIDQLHPNLGGYTLLRDV